MSLFTLRCMTSYISSQTETYGSYTNPAILFYLYDCVMSVFSLDSLHLLGPLWQCQDKNCAYSQALKLPLCPNFFTPTVLDYTTAIYPFNEARETTFPVKSIIFKWAGPFFLFFFFSTRHKVIKSWKQTLKEALSKKKSFYDKTFIYSAGDR